ncbi:MAG: hypothetical protein GX295_03320 [Syntrophomonadaceae bacterium]|nr:hypothetical protein [Syntrophomonadaceae bacterium]
MIKNLIAKALGLYTENDFWKAVRDKYNKLAIEESEKFNAEIAALNIKATQILQKHNPSPSYYQFFGLFPFVANNNYHYWFIVMIPTKTNNFFPTYKNCDIYVIHPHSSNRAAFLYFEINGHKAHIVDLRVKVERVGIGSHLLQLLEQIVKPLGVEEITGWLSPVDYKYRDVQINYYKKNGYSIKLTDDKQGWVSKSLNLQNN